MSLLFRRSNGFYYLVTFHNGHRVRRSTGKRRRIDAEKYLRDIVFQPDTSPGTTVLQNGMRLEDHRRQCVSFSEFIPQWRVYANTSFMKNTIRLYDSALKNFIRIVGDKPLNEYRAMDLEHFKSIRLKEVLVAFSDGQILLSVPPCPIFRLLCKAEFERNELCKVEAILLYTIF